MKLLRKIIVSYLIFISAFSFSLLTPTQTDASNPLSTQAQIQPADGRPSQSTTFTATFATGASYTVHCVVVQYALNADMTGGAPTGMTTTTATYGSETGLGVNGHWIVYGGFNNAATNGYYQFEDSTGDALTAGNYATISAQTVTSPSITTYYAQITTYSSAVSTHACGATIGEQSNVIALSTLAGVTTTVTVSPTLTLSIANSGSAINGSGDTSPITTTATTIPFGSVAAGATAWGSQTATVSTNAANGYALYLKDTGTLKDTNNDLLTDQTGTVTAPATFSGSSSVSSFGYTVGGTNAIAMGSNKWAGLGNAGTQYMIGTKTTSVNSDTINVEYKVEPSNTQAPGTYSTTVVYTAVPSY